MECMGERISLLIEKLGITKTAFADKLNITQPYVSKLLKTGKPSDRLIEDICEKFNVNEDWLRTGEGGDNNIFIKIPPYQKAYNKFGYIMQNSSPSKKAALTLLLELMYTIPDDKWDIIMKQYEEIKKEG